MNRRNIIKSLIASCGCVFLSNKSIAHETNKCKSDMYIVIYKFDGKLYLRSLPNERRLQEFLSESRTTLPLRKRIVAHLVKNGGLSEEVLDENTIVVLKAENTTV